MKNIFKSIATAIMYFFIYFAAQIAVTLIISIILMAKLSAEFYQSDLSIDINVLNDRLAEEILKNAMLIVLISGVVFLIVILLIYLIRKENVLKQLDLRKIRFIGIIPLILSGIFLNVFFTGLMSYIPIPEIYIESYVESYSIVEQGSFLISIISTLVIAPIVEEIVFRALVYGKLKKGMPKVVAAIISALLFAFMHGNIIWGIYTFILGIILVWIYEKFKSLTANIIVHFSFNLVGVIFGSIKMIPDIIFYIMPVISLIIIFINFIWIRKICKRKTEN